MSEDTKNNILRSIPGMVIVISSAVLAALSIPVWGWFFALGALAIIVNFD